MICRPFSVLTFHLLKKIAGSGCQEARPTSWKPLIFRSEITKAMIPEEVLYKEILDNLDEGIYIADRQSKITFWNRGAGMIARYKASDLSSQSI
jgi:PAS domain-containing protein